ncbi:MAG: LptE family protein [Deltaproteobacteria bacterium]|nr:LptE family protein [Deltaproteobacteria bacterium]MBN2845118.1 LptE family protein [Deltaproteobacteria bacterium]
MKQHVSILLTLLLILPVSGCGYRFAPAGETMDRKIKAVYIDTFRNHTSEAQVENYVRNAFINQFIRGNRFKSADEKETSDAVLSGKITGLSTSHVSYEKNDTAREDTISLSFDVEFRDSEGTILWAKKSLSGREAYRIDDNPTITGKNRKEALRKLSRDMAEKTYRDIMSGF